MISSKKGTRIFILGQNNAVHINDRIFLLKNNSNNSIKSNFVLKISIKNILGNSLNTFANTFRNFKNNSIDLPKPTNGIADRLNV